MKKIYAFAGLVLLVSGQAFAADQPYNESSQLQSQEQERTQYQAQVDPGGTPALLQAMEQNRFENMNRVRIQNMIQEAQQEGLPTEPLMNKVHEGIAKRVNEEQIVQAVQRVHNRYEKAYRQADELTGNKQQARQLGQVIAEAYTAGLIERDCAQIMSELQTRTRTMNQQEAHELRVQTMTTARVMARRGTESTTVSDVLANALQNSYQAREMQTLRNSFTEQSRYGSPENVARGFSADISHGANASGLGGRSSGSGSGQDGPGGSSGSGGSGGPGGSGDSGGSDNSGGSGGSSDSGGSDSSGGSSDSGGSGGSGDSGGSGGSGDSGGSDNSGGSGGSSDSGGSDSSGGSSDSGGSDSSGGSGDSGGSDNSGGSGGAGDSGGSGSSGGSSGSGGAGGSSSR